MAREWKVDEASSVGGRERRTKSGVRAITLSNGEVRERILDEHRRLRRMLRDLQSCARVVALEPINMPLLRARLRVFLVEFGMHLDSEEELLVPALKELDAWGPQRVVALQIEHAGQREVVESMLARAATEESAEALAIEADALVLRIFRDMADEERTLVCDAVLHDDLVVVDQCGG